MEGSVKRISFVAEAKGPMPSMELQAIEQTRIKYSRKFFTEINRKIDFEQMNYDCYHYGRLWRLLVWDWKLEPSSKTSRRPVNHDYRTPQKLGASGGVAYTDKSSVLRKIKEKQRSRREPGTEFS